MNVIDVGILLIILMGAAIGFKKGVFVKLTSFVGLILITCASFILKNTLSVIFYENLPFFDFNGAFKGLQILNVIFYEIFAFMVVFAVLYLALNVILKISGILEKILKLTIFLAIPSKILGIVVGTIEAYFYLFIILYVLNLPVVKFDMLDDSKYANFILNNTPILSGHADKTLQIYHDVYDLIDNRNGKSNAVINREALELMLENDAISVDSVNKLLEKNKIDVDNTDFVKKYEGGNI